MFLHPCASHVEQSYIRGFIRWETDAHGITLDAVRIFKGCRRCWENLDIGSVLRERLTFVQVQSFLLKKVEGFDPNCVRNPTEPHDLGPTENFMAKDDPFCLVVALTEPHVPWVMGDASKYPPKKMKLPPNIADTPRTREDFSKYLAEITYMDEQIGDILVTLKESGKEGDTLVLLAQNRDRNSRVASGLHGMRVCTPH